MTRLPASVSLGGISMSARELLRPGFGLLEEESADLHDLATVVLMVLPVIDIAYLWFLNCQKHRCQRCLNHL